MHQHLIAAAQALYPVTPQQARMFGYLLAAAVVLVALRSLFGKSSS